MSFRVWSVNALWLVAGCLGPIQAQDRFRLAGDAPLNVQPMVVEAGESWMDFTPEDELIRMLGWTAEEVNPTVTAMRISIDDGPGDTGGGRGGGGGGVGLPGTGGWLVDPSPIQSQNRWGLFRQVGSVDLIFLLDETWLWIENPVIDGITDRLANTRRANTGPNLRGFYNIHVELAPYTSASKRVYVWPDMHKMRLTWTLPNNYISCRADLNNWPDRDVEIVTTLHFTVDIETTGDWSNPTQVTASSISFSDTVADNDGTLYHDYFNQETESEFNSTHEDVPTSLTDWMFGPLSENLAANVGPSTYDLKFHYLTNETRLVFRLYNPSVSSPVFHYPTYGVLSTRR